MDCSPPGSSAYEVLKGRILEWVAILFSGEPSNPLFLLPPWSLHIQSVCRSSWLSLQNGSLLCPLLPTLPCSELSPLPWMAALTAAANAPVSWPPLLSPPEHAHRLMLPPCLTRSLSSSCSAIHSAAWTSPTISYQPQGLCTCCFLCWKALLIKLAQDSFLSFRSHP